ncbi:hypothetical protein GCM10007094_10260 [Pseudovibrio japonicus]|uniref:Methyltransferase domain-containing protein n=1 Tax=Pseudovibrio japonicus TaxID=366534 RepID=A0ABQ3E6K9_9HYPH|nr:class I SAM-dependent methyltransferase [Pseudovibrio japonicus]GHB24167.1 hypothetical protein GCM10007094_10260 [Pseudovibrio japonicus]
MHTSVGSPHYTHGSDENSFERYELFNDVLLPATQQGISSLPQRADMKVLEVGCGIGDTACYFAQEVCPEGHVTAFDISKELLAVGRKNAEERGIQNISFVCADAFDFDYAEEHYDLIHTRCVLIHLRDPATIVSKIYKALKPSGWLFVEEEYTPVRGSANELWQKRFVVWLEQIVRSGGGHPFFTRRHLPDLMASIGFQDIRAENFVFTPDQEKYFKMISLALSRELKAGLIQEEIASENVVEQMLQMFKSIDTSISNQTINMPQVFGSKPE